MDLIQSCSCRNWLRRPSIQWEMKPRSAGWTLHAISWNCYSIWLKSSKWSDSTAENKPYWRTSLGGFQNGEINSHLLFWSATRSGLLPTFAGSFEMSSFANLEIRRRNTWSINSNGNGYKRFWLRWTVKVSGIIRMSFIRACGTL